MKFKSLTRKFTWGNKAKHWWVMSTNFFFQKFVDNDQQCFAFIPQANFTAHNLNFHWRWRWWDEIQTIFLNLFYFNLNLTASALRSDKPTIFFKIILRFVFNQNTNLRDILSKAKLLLRNRNQKGNQKEVNVIFTFQLLCYLGICFWNACTIWL